MPVNKKNARIPVSPEQQAELAQLFGEVPSEKVIQYDWTSPAGRAFVKKVREIQIQGSVPLPWIAEALDLSKAALAGAIGYWERASTTRGSALSRRRRAKRPLARRGTDEIEG